MCVPDAGVQLFAIGTNLNLLNNSIFMFLILIIELYIHNIKYTVHTDQVKTYA